MNSTPKPGAASTTHLYVCDLDGTLLRSDATLSDAARDHLNRLLDAGVPITIATARSVPAVNALLTGVRLTLPIVELNGAFISDLASGRHLSHRLLAADIAEAAVRTLLDTGIDPVLTSWDGSTDHVYHGSHPNRGTAWYIAEKQAYGDPRLRHHDDLGAVAGSELVATVTTFVPDAEAGLLASRLRTELGTSALITHAPNGYVAGWSEVQIVHPEAEKGIAVDLLRAAFGPQGAQLTVFGDHLNDLSMFAVADRAVAPANAHPSVLELADLVVGANDDDGVVHFLLSERAC